MPLFKAGTMPSRVDMKIVIQPTGAVSEATVTAPATLGGEFNGCMSSAVRAVAFPPFNGPPQTTNFPFQLG